MPSVVPHPLLFQSPCIWRGELLPVGLWGKGNDPSRLGTKTRGRKGLENRERRSKFTERRLDCWTCWLGATDI